jgi:hypothetical protein
MGSQLSVCSCGVQDMQSQGKVVGIHQFICKPFRIEELQKVLNSTSRVKRVLPS